MPTEFLRAYLAATEEQRAAAFAALQGKTDVVISIHKNELLSDWLEEHPEYHNYRTLHALEQIGIKTITQLLNVKPSRLYKFRGIGRKTVSIIVDWIKAIKA